MEEVLELYSGLYVLLISFRDDKKELLCVIDIYFSSMEIRLTPAGRCQDAWCVAEIAYIYILGHTILFKVSIVVLCLPLCQ